MIISRTPFRISFLGGGTDYPAWYEKHGGAVLGTTIDKYCYIFIRELPPFFTHKHRVVYSQIELVRDYREVIHPAVRTVLQESELDPKCGLEVQHMGDLPARSAIESSRFTAARKPQVKRSARDFHSLAWAKLIFMSTNTRAAAASRK